MNTATAKPRRKRPAPQQPPDPDGRLREVLREAAETEADPRLRNWLMKLVRGDADERRQK